MSPPQEAAVLTGFSASPEAPGSHPHATVSPPPLLPVHPATSPLTNSSVFPLNKERKEGRREGRREEGREREGGGQGRETERLRDRERAIAREQAS